MQTRLPLPYFDVGLAAGFPSPADDYLGRPLDLHELLVEHPASTFFVRAEGNSMCGAGIYSGDLLVVDRSLTAKNRDIIVALLDGEFTLKRLIKENTAIYLLPENARYPKIEITEAHDFQVWGVVTYVIHRSR